MVGSEIRDESKTATPFSYSVNCVSVLCTQTNDNLTCIKYYLIVVRRRFIHYDSWGSYPCPVGSNESMHRSIGDPRYLGFPWKITQLARNILKASGLYYHWCVIYRLRR